MWSVIPSMNSSLRSLGARRRQVQCTVAGYSVRERVDQNGNTRLQANFVVTDVLFLACLMLRSPSCCSSGLVSCAEPSLPSKENILMNIRTVVRAHLMR